jgi:uncharacterized protein YmfQ (DUF2313 family)
LLPFGQAWPRWPGSVLVQAVYGLAQVWGFVDGRAADLLEIESDPRTTTDPTEHPPPPDGLLPDWERNWGLPDPCLTNPPTDPGLRRQELVYKMTLVGGQSRAFMIATAAHINYPIYISEYAPFMCGVSRCGDTTKEDKQAGGDGLHMRWEIGPPEMRFYWTVHPGPVDLIWFRCGGGGHDTENNPHGGGQCGVDPHCRISNYPDLECELNKIKPGQTQIVFDYSGGGLSNPMQGTP